MAVPTINATALTPINNADSGTGWSGWGANSTKWDDESDIKIQGAGSQGLQPSSTGDGGWGYTTASNVDLGTYLLLVWVYTTPGFLDTSTNYGVYIRICTSSTSWTTDYRDYRVGGSNVAWVGRGWRLIVLDANRTPDRSSPTTYLDQIRRIGVGFNHTATASKSTVTAIDIMRYGNKLEVTGVTTGSVSLTYNENDPSADTITRSTGSFVTDGFEAGDTIVVSGTANNNGEYTVNTVVSTILTLSTADDLTQEGPVSSIVDAYLDFEDIYRKDGPTDGNWYGIVSRNPLGVWVINYNLIIGDESGTARTRFRSRGDVIYFADQPVTAQKMAIVTKQDAGANTVFEIGNSSGEGDDRVGFSGSVVSQDDAFIGVGGYVDLSAAISSCLVYGATFLGITSGIKFGANASHRAFNCVFDGCGQIDLGTVEARNLTFSGYNLTADAALLWNSSINVKNSSFLANRNAAADAAAVEHTVAESPYYYDLLFSGNDYDINFTAASGDLEVYKEGTSDPATFKKSGTGTVNFHASYPVTVTTVDKYNDPIQYIRCAVYLAADDSEVLNLDTDENGEATDSSSTLGAVYWRVRESPVAGNRYKPKSGVGEITTSGFEVTVVMEPEPLT